MVGQIAQLRDGIHQAATGAQTLATKSRQLKAGGARLSAGAATFADGVDAYTGGVSKAAASTPKLEHGVNHYVGGVNQLSDGVMKASVGVGTFASGMTKLNGGAQRLTDGTGTFASELAAGAAKVPTYSHRDRTALAEVVSMPVNGDGPAIATSVAVVAVLLILGAWLAALVTWLVARTVPSRALSSARSTLGLLARTMSVGAIVTVAVSIGLTVTMAPTDIVRASSPRVERAELSAREGTVRATSQVARAAIQAPRMSRTATAATEVAMAGPFPLTGADTTSASLVRSF